MSLSSAEVFRDAVRSLRSLARNARNSGNLERARRHEATASRYERALERLADARDAISDSGPRTPATD